MNKHYFTFGTGFPETVQVIHCVDPERAEQIMFDTYGTDWGFQYTENQWKQSLNKGFFKNARYLKPIIVGGEADGSRN